MKLTQSNVLKHAREFFLYSEVEGSDTRIIEEKQKAYHQIIDVAIVHTQKPGEAFTVLFKAWEKMMYKNGVTASMLTAGARNAAHGSWTVFLLRIILSLSVTTAPSSCS